MLKTKIICGILFPLCFIFVGFSAERGYSNDLYLDLTQNNLGEDETSAASPDNPVSSETVNPPTAAEAPLPSPAPTAKNSPSAAPNVEEESKKGEEANAAPAEEPQENQILKPILQIPDEKTGGIHGKKISVEEMLAGVKDPQIRQQKMDAYWGLVEKLALYNLAVIHANDIEECIARYQGGEIPQNQAALLLSARRVAAQRVQEAKIQFLQGQLDFAESQQKAETNSKNRSQTPSTFAASASFNSEDLPIPSDQPTTLPYETRYDEIKKGKRLSLDAARLNETIPAQFQVIQSRETEVNETLTAFKTLYFLPTVSEELLLSAADRHCAAKEGYVRAAIEYNRQIAAYVAETVGGGVQGDRLLLSMNQIPKEKDSADSIPPLYTQNEKQKKSPVQRGGSAIPIPETLPSPQENGGISPVSATLPQEKTATASSQTPAPSQKQAPSQTSSSPKMPNALTQQGLSLSNPKANLQAAQTPVFSQSAAPTAEKSASESPSPAISPERLSEIDLSTIPNTSTSPTPEMVPLAPEMEFSPEAPLPPPPLPNESSQNPSAPLPSSSPSGGTSTNFTQFKPLFHSKNLIIRGQEPTHNAFPAEGDLENPEEAGGESPSVDPPSEQNADSSASESASSADGHQSQTPQTEEEFDFSSERHEKIRQVTETLFPVNVMKSGGGDSEIVEIPLTLHQALRQSQGNEKRLETVASYWRLRSLIAILNAEEHISTAGKNAFDLVTASPSDAPEFAALTATWKAFLAESEARAAETKIQIRAEQLTLMKGSARSPELGWPIPSSLPCFGPYSLASDNAQIRNFQLLTESVLIPEKIKAVWTAGLAMGEPSTFFTPEVTTIGTIDDGYLYLKTLENKRLTAISYIKMVESLNNSIARYVAAFSSTPLSADVFADCLIGKEKDEERQE